MQQVDTIQRLLNQTVTGKSQGNLWLVGERQVGKTSLLRYIQLAYEDFNERIHIYGSTKTVKVAFIYFNCQTLKNPDDYYHHIYQSLINHFDFKHTGQENAYACYIETFKRAYDSNYYIVLLLDEFDAFLQRLIQNNANQAEYLLSDINKMSQSFSEIKTEPKVFGCIFAANYTLTALVEKINVPGSGLISEMIELPFFTFQQMKELANHYLKDDTLEFSDQEVQYCYEMTNGYPYFVQKLFSLMYDHHDQLQTNDEIDYQKITLLYQQELNSTIAHWGNETMPPRTKAKIQGIIEKFKPNLERTENKEEYDVFLCHNVNDKDLVKIIATQLKSQKIKPWLDEWALLPGIPWQDELEKQIQNIKSAAIFIGNNEMGPLART